MMSDLIYDDNMVSNYDYDTMMMMTTTCDAIPSTPDLQCEACGVECSINFSSCATGTHVYCSDACRTVDGPRHAALCLATAAAVVVVNEEKNDFFLDNERVASQALFVPAQSLSEWIQQSKDDLVTVDAKRRRISVVDEVGAAHALFAPLLLDDVVGLPVDLSEYISQQQQQQQQQSQPLQQELQLPQQQFLPQQFDFLQIPESEVCAVGSESPLSASATFTDDDDEATASFEPRLAQQPRRARNETAAKKNKRNEYAHLDDAERDKLRALGVTEVDALAVEFAQVVDKVVYLHTRRQHIIVWLADSPLFPLISWDRVELDDCGQPRLLLHTKREFVHQALAILLKSDITEWLFKRVRRATTSEGAWLFKPGQFQLLLKHAQKAVGDKR